MVLHGAGAFTDVLPRVPPYDASAGKRKCRCPRCAELTPRSSPKRALCAGPISAIDLPVAHLQYTSAEVRGTARPLAEAVDKVLKSFFDAHPKPQADAVTDLSRYTALQLVSSHGDLSSVRGLLKLGAHPNVQEPVDGTSALHLASYGGFSSIVGLLLQAGANDELRTISDGYTALHIAALRGHADVVKRLLASDHAAVKVDERSSAGIGRTLTPLMLSSYSGHDNVVRVLLQAGAQLELKWRGLTAMDLAQLAVRGGNEAVSAELGRIIAHQGHSRTIRVLVQAALRASRVHLEKERGIQQDNNAQSSNRNDMVAALDTMDAAAQLSGRRATTDEHVSETLHHNSQIREQREVEEELQDVGMMNTLFESVGIHSKLHASGVAVLALVFLTSMVVLALDHGLTRAKESSHSPMSNSSIQTTNHNANPVQTTPSDVAAAASTKQLAKVNRAKRHSTSRRRHTSTTPLASQGTDDVMTASRHVDPEAEAAAAAEAAATRANEAAAQAELAAIEAEAKAAAAVAAAAEAARLAAKVAGKRVWEVVSTKRKPTQSQPISDDDNALHSKMEHTKDVIADKVDQYKIHEAGSSGPSSVGMLGTQVQASESQNRSSSALSDKSSMSNSSGSFYGTEQDSGNSHGSRMLRRSRRTGRTEHTSQSDGTASAHQSPDSSIATGAALLPESPGVSSTVPTDADINHQTNDDQYKPRLNVEAQEFVPTLLLPPAQQTRHGDYLCSGANHMVYHDLQVYQANAYVSPFGDVYMPNERSCTIGMSNDYIVDHANVMATYNMGQRLYLPPGPYETRMYLPPSNVEQSVNGGASVEMVSKEKSAREFEPVA